MMAAINARDPHAGGTLPSGHPYPGETNIASGGRYFPDTVAPFLGPPTKRIDAEPSNAFPHEAWQLPDAYRGRNEYVRDTLVDLVVNSNSFMTNEILPFKEQQNINVAWESIKFDRTLVDLEPEQGVPRYVTVEREAHSDYMVRRGIALIVNHGFAATPGGQRDFMYKVATIAGAVQETCDQSAVMALLRCKNMYRGQIHAAMRSASSAYDLCCPELQRWAAVQMNERGLFHVDADAQQQMRCENVQPDTWIFPGRMAVYATMAQPAETEAYRAGETVARGNLERGEDNLTTFRGKSVYEIRPYHLDVDGRTVDPLNRPRMIGDFFVVPCFEQRRDATGPEYPEYGAGRTQAYCCASDRFETFRWDSLSRDIDAHLRKWHPAEDERAKYMGMFVAAAAAAPAQSSARFDAPRPVSRPVSRRKPSCAPTPRPRAPKPASRPRAPKPPSPERVAATRARAVVRSAVELGLARRYGAGDDVNAVRDPVWACERYAKDLAAHVGPNKASAARAVREALADELGRQVRSQGRSHAEIAELSASQFEEAYVRGESADEHTPLSLAMRSVQASGAALRRVRDSGALASENAVEGAKTKFVIGLLNFGQLSTFQGKNVEEAKEFMKNLRDSIELQGGQDNDTFFPPFLWYILMRVAQAYAEELPWEIAAFVEEAEGAIKKIYQEHTKQGIEDLESNCGLVVPSEDEADTQYTSPYIGHLKTARQGAKPALGGFAWDDVVGDYVTYVAQLGEANEGVSGEGSEAVNVFLDASTAPADVEHNGEDTPHDPPENEADPSQPEMEESLEETQKSEDPSNGRPSVSPAPGPSQEDQMPLWDVLCVRPFREYTMGSGILCQRGSRLGNTFRAYADFQLTDNIIAKTHIGHFTFWHASVVTDPKCLFLAEDIFCGNYEAGENHNVLSWEYVDDFVRDPVGTMRQHDASIIAFPVPIGAIDPVDRRVRTNNPLSLTGSLDPVRGAHVGPQSARKVDIGDYREESAATLYRIAQQLRASAEHLARTGVPGNGNAHSVIQSRMAIAEQADGLAERIRAKEDFRELVAKILEPFQFDKMNHQVDYDNSDQFETENRVINTMLFHTMQRFMSPATGQWTVSNLNTGHFGPNGIYEGSKKVKCGFIGYAKQVQYEQLLAAGSCNATAVH